jgi:hypothetical protein
MKTIAFLFITQIFCTYSFSQNSDDTAAIKNKLIELEKQSWEAWKNQDSSFFVHFLSNDHIEMGSYGAATKEQVVHGIASHACAVTSYKVVEFKLKMLSENLAVIIYHAEQNTQCMNTPVPSPVWVSSLYIRRNDKWENVLYQQTKADN